MLSQRQLEYKEALERVGISVEFRKDRLTKLSIGQYSREFTYPDQEECVTSAYSTSELVLALIRVSSLRAFTKGEATGMEKALATFRAKD